MGLGLSHVFTAAEVLARKRIYRPGRNGYVDLLFEYNGKYYILDWKSNHRGNSIEDYHAAGLTVAMKGSNYNLQYMIYTLAVKR